MGIREVRAEVQNGVRTFDNGGYAATTHEVAVKAGDAVALLGNLVLMLEDTTGLDVDSATGAANKIQGALDGTRNPLAERAAYFAGQAREKVEDVTTQAVELLPAIRDLVAGLNLLRQTGSEASIAVGETCDSAKLYLTTTYGKPGI